MVKKKRGTKEPPKKAEAYDIWNNPMVTSAKKNLSEDDLERWKALGESMYGKVDFEKGQVASDIPPEEEALAYIEESLKSGLHPSMLEDDEKNLLEYKYGEQWFEHWGYVKGDLTDIITIKKVN